MAIEIAQNLDAINMVRAQQNVVGRSIIGGAGAIGNRVAGGDDQSNILTSIQIITEKTFRNIKSQTEILSELLLLNKKENELNEKSIELEDKLLRTLNEMFKMDLSKDRREREQSAELDKENKRPKLRGSSGGQSGGLDEDGDGSFFGGLATGALATRFTGIFKGIKNFIDIVRKNKFITNITKIGAAFGRFGPIGMLILGFSALVRYGEDLVKALQPLIDGMKKTAEILQPITDAFLGIADTIIKTGFRELGTALEAAMIMFNNSLQFVVDILGDLASLINNLIFFDLQGIFDSLSGIGKTFKDMNTKIANVIIDALHGLIDSLPLLTDGMRNKLKSFVGEKVETPSQVDEKDLKDETKTVSTTENKGGNYFDQLSSNTTSDTKSQSDGGIVSQLSEPKKPKVVNMDKTSSATKVAEKVTGNPNIPPLGLNMYQTTGDTWRERADQWNEFKKALVQAEKDGSISGEELKFRVMQLKAEKDSLQNAKKILDVKKQRAEITGETVDEAGFLKERDVEGMAQQERILAETGDTVASFDQALNQKLKPNVNKRDLSGGNGEGSGGAIITDAKQTIVQNSNVNKSDHYSGSIHTSSGDSYFDRQTGSYAT